MSFYMSGNAAPQTYRPMPFLVPRNNPDVIQHVGATRGPASTTLLKPEPKPEIPMMPEKKKGRPSKKDILKEKRARASDAIQELLDSEPTKNKVADYFRCRIEELDEDD